MVSKILSRLGPDENAFVVCGSEHLAGLQGSTLHQDRRERLGILP